MSQELQVLLHRYCPPQHTSQADKETSQSVTRTECARSTSGSSSSAVMQAVTPAGSVSQPVQPHMSQRGGVLVAGCGNSTLGVELWRAGHRPVVNADYIQVCDCVSYCIMYVV